MNAETVSRLSTRLLPGWYDNWAVLEQERWDQLRLHALEAAAEVLLCRGQHMLALEAGLVAARSELFRESAHRVIIRVYLAEGNVGAAMQHYRDYQRKLRRELNLAPTTAMDELIHPLIALTHRSDARCPMIGRCRTTRGLPAGSVSSSSAPRPRPTASSPLASR